MSKSLYVGNLPWATTNEELLALFQTIGAVLHVQVMTDHDTGRSRGFAFVEMANNDEARAAIDTLHGTAFQGRPLVVNESKGQLRRGHF